MLDVVEISQVTRAMLTIQALDPSAKLEFLSHNLWWVHVRIETSTGDGMLVGDIGATHSDPGQAVLQTLANMQAVKEPKSLVVNAYGVSGPRREYRWNGAAFAETWESRKGCRE